LAILRQSAVLLRTILCVPLLSTLYEPTQLTTFRSAPRPAHRQSRTPIAGGARGDGPAARAGSERSEHPAARRRAGSAGLRVSGASGGGVDVVSLQLPRAAGAERTLSELGAAAGRIGRAALAGGGDPE